MYVYDKTLNTFPVSCLLVPNLPALFFLYTDPFFHLRALVFVCMCLCVHTSALGLGSIDSKLYVRYLMEFCDDTSDAIEIKTNVLN